jgi:hypothetical protein
MKHVLDDDGTACGSSGCRPCVLQTLLSRRGCGHMVLERLSFPNTQLWSFSSNSSFCGVRHYRSLAFAACSLSTSSILF